MSLSTAIKYSPQSTQPSISHVDVVSLLSSNNIRYVRIQWVDLANEVRCRILSVSHFCKLLVSCRPGVAMAKAALGAVFLELAPGFNVVGEYVYVFDLSSFRTCHYAPRHAVFFGFFQEKSVVPRPSGPSFEVLCCPRTVLSRLVKYATEELGVQFLIGFETEFVLLKSTDPIVPVHIHQWSSTSSVTTGTVEAQVLEEIADALQADGIELEMYHAEAAPGQYEVVTGPLPPLQAADALVHTRQTIYNIAKKHGLKATVAPRLALDTLGNGAHMHVSVRGERQGESRYEFLTPVESSFLSGLMHHLSSVISLTLPLPASYTRMVDGVCSGGTWVCWGVDNREAPVRLANATNPSSRNFEIKPVDGTSNPYLAVAGVLASGIVGIRGALPLGVDNCAVPAAEMSSEEREASGVTKRMPLSVEEARRYLAADDAIREILGVELINTFIQANEMIGKQIDRREGEPESLAMARLIENF